MKFFATVLISFFLSHLALSQCIDNDKVYFFEYNDHTYQLVKEKKSWTEAAACAVSEGGYLAELTDEDEHNMVFAELIDHGGIVENETYNQFGTASVWLGGTDLATEGTWIWDGNNDGEGETFWIGGPSGSPVGDYEVPWGTSPAEPDNSGNQDHLSILVHNGKVNYGKLNDLQTATNQIFYLIEYDFITTVEDESIADISIFPNPASDFIIIENLHPNVIDDLSIYNIMGQSIMTLDSEKLTNHQIDISSLPIGNYVLKLRFKNGASSSKKLVKK